MYMLDLINRYAHGFVAVPVILACREHGIFELITQKQSLNLEAIVEHFQANSGHLQVALRLLHSLNFLSQDEVGAYSLTEKSKQHQMIPNDILSLYNFPVDLYLRGKLEVGLQNWIARSSRRWDINDSLISDFLDGVLLIPILLELRKQNLLANSEKLFSELAPSVRQELSALFISLGWVIEQKGSFHLTEVGQYLLDRTLNFGVTASYAPMLSQMSELLFGNPRHVFQKDDGENETHLNRTLNVVASGFQHEKFFIDTDELIISIFNQLPFEEQPSYVVDMGSGDGTLLKRIYHTILHKSARGKILAKHPVYMVGVDYNQQALEVTDRNLAEIPHLVLQGDIGDPERLLANLKTQGINPENVLHIRSFLDHDRPFVHPVNTKELQLRSRLDYQGVDVDSEGKLIPNYIAVQSLVEHLRRWSSIITGHGLLLLEVHSLTPAVVQKFLDESESLHFDACQAFSMQHLVEADVFLMAAAEVGLFPQSNFLRKYPKVLPFTRISLNYFEKRPYIIRHPYPEDLSALVDLEKQCWPGHLQLSASELEQRIEASPSNHLVLVLEGQVVSVIYTQRIETVETLKSSTFRTLSSLQVREGPVLQLLSLNTHPDMQGLGLGDQLRKFTLQWAVLKGDVKWVAGVTRCKSYVNHSHLSMREYVEKRNERAEVFDPILRFHVGGGASIVSLVPNYRPEDSDNQGFGILIRYELHETLETQQANETQVEFPRKSLDSAKSWDFSDLVEQSIETVLGKKRMEGFSSKRPLKEIGCDSLELLEIRSLLVRSLMENGLMVKMDSKFFFDYSTPAAIADYLRQHVRYR